MMTHVKVGPVHYTVEESSDLYGVDEDGIHRRLYGSVDHVAAHIRLAENQSKDMQAITLTHELIHAIFEERKINLPPDDEESVVDKLAYAFVSLIRDNPGLVEFLCVNHTPSVEAG